MERRKGQGKKSHWHSYKKNRPVRRFMTFSDARGVFREVWGGYSPKVYDSDFMRIVSNQLEEFYEGATLIADNHFKKIADELSVVTIIAPSSERKPKGDDEGKAVEVPTHAETARNKKIRKLRARVEMLYARLNSVLGSLYPCWRDTPERLNNAVRFGIGVINWRLTHPKRT